MSRDSIIDYTFTADESALIKRAIAYYGLEQARSAKVFDAMGCVNMASLARKECQQIEQVQKLIG